jgi:MFS family permease
MDNDLPADSSDQGQSDRADLQVNPIVRFFRFPDLPELAAETYRHHFLFTVLHAMASGIFANSAAMAVMGLAAEDWQLGIRMWLSSFGMFATLFLGSWMVGRRKMRFVLTPGWGYVGCSVVAACCESPFWFLLALGVGSAFEIAVRTAITSVVRLNYPAEVRGTAVGELRKWSALVFLVSAFGSAWWLRENGGQIWMIRTQLILAGFLAWGALFAFRKIKVHEPEPSTAVDIPRQPFATMVSTAVRDSFCILRRDRRFRNYLLSCFMYGFFVILFTPFVPAVLIHDMGLGYIGCALLLDVIPSAMTFLATGYFGRWADRHSPWLSWTGVRAGMSFDPFLLAIAVLVMPFWAPLAMGIAIVGRSFRGATIGGSWILWWRVGVNHFAPTSDDTGKYMGLFVFQNGLLRLIAPMVGSWLIFRYSRETMLIVAGSGILLSAVHSTYFWLSERGKPELATVYDFERTQEQELEKSWTDE